MPLRIFWGSLLLLGLLRLLAAVSVPLSGDEAYYWEWTRHLAAGYHDHPPMVAWIITVSTALLGQTTLAVRLPFVLMGTALPPLTYLLARRMHQSDSAAVAAGGLLLVIPLFTLAGIAAFPDGPLLFAAALFLLCAWCALEDDGPAWWLAAGAAAGTAALSKLTGLYLLPSFFLYLLTSPRHSPWLRRPGPYVAIAVALLVWSPFLVWNWAHSWESFTYQYGSRLGSAHGFGIKHLLEYLAFSAAALSPLVFLILWWVLLRLALSGRDQPVWYLFCMALPLQAFFLLCSLRVKIGLHWAAPALLATCAAFGWWLQSSASRRRTAFVAAALSLAVLISGIVYVAALSPPTLLGAISTLRMRGINKGEPLTSSMLAEVLGYPQAAAQVHAVADGRRARGSQPFLFTTNYALSSALAFYSGETLHVVMGTAIGAEYDRWDDFPSWLGHDGLYVDTCPIDSREDVWRNLRQAFESVELQPPFSTQARGVGSRTYYLAICHNFRNDVFTALKATRIGGR